MFDINQQGDHTIILGDSLKDEQRPPTHLGVRYNWLPKHTVDRDQDTLKGSEDNLKLRLQNANDKYDYSGWLATSGQESPELLLVYDNEKSAFVLEKVAASLDMNITSATNVSADQIGRYTKFKRPAHLQDASANVGDQHDLFDDEDGGESPDSSNPFDYRHFLTEAKDSVEKKPHANDSRTPLGGLTPLSGLSSPLPVHGNHNSNTTPQFAPIEIVSKRDIQENRRRPATFKSKRPTTNRQPHVPTQSSRPSATAAKRAPVLSSERVIDSDSDNDSSRSAASSPRHSLEEASPKKPVKGHNRNVSGVSVASVTKSPRIIVDDSGLDIEPGSPPASKKRHYLVDTNAFGSRPGTPSQGRSPMRPGTAASGNDRPVSRNSHVDEEMHDVPGLEEDEEEDTNMAYFQDDDDDDPFVKDADVTDLILDDDDDVPPMKHKSPSPEPLPAPSKRSSQQQKTQPPKSRKKARQDSLVSAGSRRRKQKSQSPPPPGASLQHSSSMDDDNDSMLAAELEAALEQDGFGLGIEVEPENESDVSEEE